MHLVIQLVLSVCLSPKYIILSNFNCSLNWKFSEDKLTSIVSPQFIIIIHNFDSTRRRTAGRIFSSASGTMSSDLERVRQLQGLPGPWQGSSPHRDVQRSEGAGRDQQRLSAHRRDVVADLGGYHHFRLSNSIQCHFQT